MSDGLLAATNVEAGERRRAVWALTVLALVAVIVVTLMVFFLNTSGGNPDTAPLFLPSHPARTSTPHLPRSSAPVRPRHTRRPRGTPGPVVSSFPASASRSATGTTTSCPTSTPCVLEGDGGQVVAALNHLRTSRGLPAVPGTVATSAQECALQDGNVPPCPSSYFWEPVPQLDGAEVIGKISANADPGGLLDPAMKSFTIGWSYAPKEHQYKCAIVTVG